MGTNEDARGAAGTPGAPDYPQADPAGGRKARAVR